MQRLRILLTFHKHAIKKENVLTLKNTIIEIQKSGTKTFGTFNQCFIIFKMTEFQKILYRKHNCVLITTFLAHLFNMEILIKQLKVPVWWRITVRSWLEIIGLFTLFTETRRTGGQQDEQWDPGPGGLLLWHGQECYHSQHGEERLGCCWAWWWMAVLLGKHSNMQVTYEEERDDKNKLKNKMSCPFNYVHAKIYINVKFLDGLVVDRHSVVKELKLQKRYKQEALSF